MKIREDIKHEISWQVKEGNSSFWFDDWTKLGALYFVMNTKIDNKEVELQDFITDGQWSRNKLMEVLQEELIEYIIDSIKPPERGESVDKAWWVGDTSGIFFSQICLQNIEKEEGSATMDTKCMGQRIVS